ncbi:LysR family transcriptional regulator [Snodgrassella alvi]|uniref:LysR family transcriptional regulator n=1 Tax=Snodgrassella alvi TaxID=1196083 RepID=UPI0035193D5C
MLYSPPPQEQLHPDNSVLYSRHLPTIKQLQYFLAVCEEGNFRKAASRLGISQPPLSMQIKELEQKLQTTLLVRNTRYVLLTEQGREFREKAKSWLEGLSQAVNYVHNLPAGKVTMGITKILGFNFIPLFSEFIRRFNQHIDLLQQDYTCKELMAEFNKSNIDMVIISEYKNTSLQAKSLLVHREKLVLALPEQHPASVEQEIDLNMVQDLPLYWCKRYQHPNLYDKLQKVNSQLSKPLLLKEKLPNFLTMLMEIAMGRAMLLLPDSMAQAQVAGVVYKKLTAKYEQMLSMDMHLLWHTSAMDNPTIQAITEYFTQQDLPKESA